MSCDVQDLPTTWRFPGYSNIVANADLCLRVVLKRCQTTYTTMAALQGGLKFVQLSSPIILHGGVTKLTLVRDPPQSMGGSAEPCCHRSATQVSQAASNMHMWKNRCVKQSYNIWCHQWLHREFFNAMIHGQYYYCHSHHDLFFQSFPSE